MKKLFTLIVMALLFVACQTEDDHAMHDDSTTEDMMDDSMSNEHMSDSGSDMAHATMDGDVQVVNITVETMGYSPSAIELKAGVPARLVFTRETESKCAEQIQFPHYGIEVTDLPLNEPVAFDIMPEEDGEFVFACGMNMMKGTVVVKS